MLTPFKHVLVPTDFGESADRALALAIDMASQERYPKTESAHVCGELWRAILEIATERDVDLIVMGTHGRRGLSRLFLGSIAEKVVRLSPVPVLTVSTEAEKKARALALAHADATER